MNKTLLVILSYEKANDAVARHWPWWERTGFDILGVGREDSRCYFPPSAQSIGNIPVGKDSYTDGDNLPRRIIDVLDWCLNHASAYDYFCLIEHDCLLFAPPPNSQGFTATLAGHRDQGFHGSRYFHSPYLFSRVIAIHTVEYGRRMLAAGLIEEGWPDRFLGLLWDLYDLPFRPAHTYSRNALDTPEYIAEARAAIKDGAWAVHGCKTLDQFEALTKDL